MESKRMNIHQLDPNLWLLDDAGESTCYLIQGTERALLLDTVNGQENLHDIVRTLTDLPLVVVNTHGHGDHIGGNVFFEEAWLHPADNEVVKKFLEKPEVKAYYEKHGWKSAALRALSIGQVFDLGGTVLEVVPMEGHTRGSIGLLDRQRRALFTGDALNQHLWMQLDHSLPISGLLAMLQRLKSNWGSDFDVIYHAHAKEAIPAALLDTVIEGCEELLRGETAQDQPYTWFCGTCMRHPCERSVRADIIYTEEKRC